MRLLKAAAAAEPSTRGLCRRRTRRRRHRACTRQDRDDEQEASADRLPTTFSLKAGKVSGDALPLIHLLFRSAFVGCAEETGTYLPVSAVRRRLNGALARSVFNLALAAAGMWPTGFRSSSSW